MHCDKEKIEIIDEVVNYSFEGTESLILLEMVGRKDDDPRVSYNHSWNILEILKENDVEYIDVHHKNNKDHTKHEFIFDMNRWCKCSTASVRLIREYKTVDGELQERFLIRVTGFKYTTEETITSKKLIEVMNDIIKFKLKIGMMHYDFNERKRRK